MKRIGRIAQGLVCAVAVLFGIAAAQRTQVDAPRDIPEPGQGDPSGLAADAGLVSPTLWFVELSSVPLAESGTSDPNWYLGKLRREKRAFRSAAAAAGLRFVEHGAYDTLWNGLAVAIAPLDLLKLSRVPGVAGLFPIQTAALPDPAVAFGPGESAPELFTAITMTGADKAQAEGLSGAGIVVGVIDTGIDYNHPDLGGGFGPGFRVEGGYDFVGDAYTGGTSTPHPDADPMDCNGHGTHVSGIVGARGGVRGVAPGVTFRAYRVFGCSGTATDDVILAAMERAFGDGVRIVNMSLGSSFGWPRYPLARAADSLINHGVVVVNSAGNAGANGLYSMSAPGVGKKVIGTASVDNIRVHSPAVEIGGTLYGYQPMSNAAAPPTSGLAGIADGGRACNVDRPLPAAVAGRVALIIRGVCSFREKALNARAAGATAALIYNSGSGIFFGTLGAPTINYPVAGLSREDGLAILALLPATLAWTDRFADALNATGGLISSFSAFGDSPDLALKPDLSAPGGLIFSTLPLALGGYGLNSGTSMASPHVAGAVALLLEARPDVKSQVVRDILQNSATPGLWSGNPGLGFLEVTHHQGAGLLDIEAAIHATTKVTPGKLSLGETEGLPITSTLDIENDGASDVTYDLAHRPALATGPNTFTVQFGQADATVAFSAPSVSVPAGGTASVDVTIGEPAGLPDRSLFGGFIVVSPRGGGRELRVPYSGFKGDYQSIVVLNPAASPFGNPLLRATASFGPSGPVTIHPAQHEPALLLVHLDHQARRLRLEVFDAASGKSFGRLGQIDYIERNATQGEFSILAWDGTDPRGGLVPAGTYVLRLSILKALGDETNPAHTEAWTSPAVTVVR